MCLMFIQGFALHRQDVVIALIIACLAFLGRTFQNLILVSQPNSVTDLDLESLEDLITGAVMCIFALLFLLPTLVANSYDSLDQENAPKVHEEAPQIVESRESLVDSTRTQNRPAKEALR